MTAKVIAKMAINRGWFLHSTEHGLNCEKWWLVKNFNSKYKFYVSFDHTPKHVLSCIDAVDKFLENETINDGSDIKSYENIYEGLT